MIERVEIRTGEHTCFIDVGRDVERVVRRSGLAEGRATVFVPHTTAGVTIQENADPPLKVDLLEAFERLFPWRGPYRHSEDNAAAHMKATLVGNSVTIPFQDGTLLLGTWQSIYLCEFDGPRRREVVVQVGS